MAGLEDASEPAVEGAPEDSVAAALAVAQEPVPEVAPDGAQEPVLGAAPESPAAQAQEPAPEGAAETAAGTDASNSPEASPEAPQGLSEEEFLSGVPKTAKPSLDKKPFIGSRFFVGPTKIFKITADLFQALFSKDRPTRRGAVLYFLSCFGVVAVIMMSIHRYQEYRKNRPHVLTAKEIELRKLQEIGKRFEHDSRIKSSTLILDEVTVDIQSDDEHANAEGNKNLAQISVVVICDSPETRKFIEGHVTGVQNEINNVLASVNRNELLSRTGKTRLRKLLMERLNLWLPKGKIDQLYFNKLLVM